jgi:hypothetical protein
MNGADKQLRAMLEALPQPGDAPDRQRLEQIRSRITSSLNPVKPLPSDRVLILIALLCFIGLSLLFAIRSGVSGLHVLSGVQQVAYYGFIAVLAVLFATATVEHMIPGSKKRVNAPALVIGSFVSLALIICLLFQEFSLNHFVEYGLPCLKLGTECGLVSGLVAFWLVRKGFFTSPVASITLLGLFAGLSGFAALAFICPVLNAPHILVWHLGPMIIGGLGGGVVGILKKL